MTITIDYEPSYEYDEGFYGNILAFNLRGHDLDLDVIESFLHERFLDDEIDWGGWEVRESWLRKVPAPDGDGMMHHYTHKPGPGARAVTVLERPSGWPYWCINHPMEPAASGRPAPQVLDGEELVARRLAELAEEVDPRRDVEEGYVYMCRECSDDFSERLRLTYLEARGGRR